MMHVSFVKVKNNLDYCLTKLMPGIKKRSLCGSFMY